MRSSHASPPLGRAAPAHRRPAPPLTAAAALLLLLALAAPAAAQQGGRISGRITAGGQPLAAAQVFLVGTGLGTITGPNGRYLLLDVPAGSYTLRVERIGHRAADVSVQVRAGEVTEANVSMETEALGLDELVVTGTGGAARRREVGNSIAQINPAELVEPPVNLDAMLQARAPGVSVWQGSGVVGSGAMIRLRGNVSVTMSNQPLIYVDGVRIRSEGFAKNVPTVGYQGRSPNDIASPLNNIDPNDVERIEIIKGAAATTLYGTEAAAGVIQVFTKRGHTGRPQWTMEIDQGIARTLPFGPDPSLAPASDARDVKLPAGGSISVAPGRSAAGGSSSYLFIDPWLRDAHRQRYSLSVGGGGDALRYYVSGTRDDNEGVLPNDHEKRHSIRGNFSFTPIRNLQFDWSTGYTSTELDYTAVGNNAHGLTLNAFRRDRNYRSSDRLEVVDSLLNQDISTDIDHLITSGTMTWSPTAAMSHRLTVGYDLAQQNNRNLRPFGFVAAPQGILADRRYEYATLSADYVGSYAFQFGDLRSSLSWGGQAVETQEQETAAYGENFPGPGDPTVSNGGSRLGFEERMRVVNAGFFVQDMLDLRNRYFLTLGVRVDGNSAFGEDFGLQAYPKASFSWVISDEGFWPAVGQAKLRFAWGQAGRAPGVFDAVKTWNAVGWGTSPAFFPGNLGNPELGPERSTEIEAGADFSVLDDRLTGEFTYYRSKTTDALLGVRQMPSNGYLESQLRNVGELENKGIELGLTGTLVRRESFGWELGGTVFTNKSEVLSLGVGSDGVTPNPDVPMGGPDVASNFGWIVKGQPVPVIRAACVTNPDQVADPIIKENCDIGPNLPTHTFGIHTTFSLPFGITLTGRGEYQGGAYMYDGAAYNAVVRSVIWPGCYEAYAVRDQQGVDAMTALQRARCTPSKTRPDFFVYPADFFKLREVSLSVPVPTRYVPQASSARLTISGRNAWKWVTDEFPVFEPEITNNDGFRTPVRSILEHVPPPAVYTVALRVTF